MRAALAGLVALAAAGPARAHHDGWLGRDKALHFGAAGTLAVTGYAVGAAASDAPWARLAAGGALPLAAGAAKELWDLSGRGDPSWKDLAWDGLGAAAGLAVAWAIDALFAEEEPPPPAPPPPGVGPIESGRRSVSGASADRRGWAAR